MIAYYFLIEEYIHSFIVILFYFCACDGILFFSTVQTWRWLRGGQAIVGPTSDITITGGTAMTVLTARPNLNNTGRYVCEALDSAGSVLDSAFVGNLTVLSEFHKKKLSKDLGLKLNY